MTETYRTVIQPEFLQVFMAGEKSAAGTPGTTGIKELVKSCVTTITHQIVEVKDRFGMAQTSVDRVQTTHEAQIKIQTGWHFGGMGPRVLFNMLGASTGGAADATSGASDPYTHAGTIGTTSNRQNTETIWHDTGDGNMLLLAQCTPEELMLSWSEDAELICDITMRALFPAMATPLYTDQGEVTYVAPPAGANLKTIGKDYVGTPTVGINAAYAIRSSSGSVYPNIASGGQIDLKRTASVKYGNDPAQSYGGAGSNPQQRRNPIDICSSELMLSGVLDLEYLGIPNNGVYQDYLKFAKTGTSGNPNKIKFVDSDGHQLELISWPWTYDMGDIQEQAEYLTSNMSFTANNDRTTLLSGNGSTMLQANLLSPIPASEALIW